MKKAVLVKKLKKANDENDDLKNKNEKLKDENSNLKKEVKDLNKKTDDLQKLLDDNKELTEKVSKHSIVSGLNGRINKLVWSSTSARL